MKRVLGTLFFCGAFYLYGAEGKEDEKKSLSASHLSTKKIGMNDYLTNITGDGKGGNNNNGEFVEVPLGVGSSASKGNAKKGGSIVSGRFQESTQSCRERCCLFLEDQVVANCCVCMVATFACILCQLWDCSCCKKETN